ncbi:hypothetical protein H6G51_18480 [Limnothrix sp. FACHB-708]|nr:hypothetical protein [Limnothrix sp. FACHB-406]MBD2555277.1 hypothetical protein [Limnothrix sp. FACHB-708]MBD2592701.1 hypothetical protein [Limnothrix sp. FACHB-406]
MRGQQLQKFSSRERRAIGWDGHGHRLDTWGAGFIGRWFYRGDRLG